MSQSALARAIGVTKQLVSAVSLGQAAFSPETLGKAAEVLGCEIADLLFNDRSNVEQLVNLVSLGSVSFGPEDLGEVAEVLGCEIADLSPEDLATVATALGCEVSDLVAQEHALPCGQAVS